MTMSGALHRQLPNAGRLPVSLDTDSRPRQSHGEHLAPAQNCFLLSDVVRRIDQGEALGQRRARLVVLDVAGDEHVGDARHATCNRLCSGAGEASHTTDEALAVAGVAQRRHPQHCGDLGSKRGQRERLGQLSETAQTERRDLVVDRVNVEGGLFIRVRADKGADHPPA